MRAEFIRADLRCSAASSLHSLSCSGPPAALRWKTCHPFRACSLTACATSARLGPGVGRAGRMPLGQTPSDEPGHRIAARMIRTETLREKDPYSNRGRVDPTLPKRSRHDERFPDTTFRKQCRKVQVAVLACLRNRCAKRMSHRRPSCLGDCCNTPFWQVRPSFVHITFWYNNLQKFKCRSVLTPFSFQRKIVLTPFPRPLFPTDPFSPLTPFPH